MDLFKVIKEKSIKFPQKIALVIDNNEYTYKDFFELIVQTIKNLKKIILKKRVL